MAGVHTTELNIDTAGLPDRVQVNLDDKDPDAYSIVVEDDTPEADRGQPTSSLEAQEDDLRDVGEKARKRIDRLKFERETERRGREQSDRERDAALEAARVAMAETAELRNEAGTATTALGTSMLAQRQEALKMAQRELADAHSAGDGEKIAEATTKVATLSADISNLRMRVPPTPAEGTQPAQQQQPQAQQQQAPRQQQQPQVTMAPRAAAWISHHRDWFGRPGNEAKTNMAYATHNVLVGRHVDPNSPEYTRELDRALKAVYPDHIPFEETPAPGNGNGVQPPRRTNVASDGSRENGVSAPAIRPDARSVVLSSSQLAIAKKLGVSPQNYAKSLVKQAAKESGAR